MGIAECQTFLQQLDAILTQHNLLLLRQCRSRCFSSLYGNGTDFPCRFTGGCLLRFSTQSEQFSRLCPLHSRHQHPLAGTAHIPGQQFPIAHIHTQSDILQIRIQMLVGIGHDQTISCPGQRHIQHPHLFRQAVSRDLYRNGLFRNGRIANPVHFVHCRKAQAQCLVTKHLCPGTFPVEASGKASHNDHREFQALGFVDTHQGHCTGSGRLSGSDQALILQAGNMLQKLLQIPTTALFKGHRQGIKGLQIGFLCLSAGFGGIYTVHTGQGKDILQQYRQRLQSCLPTQSLQDLQKVFRLFRFPDAQGIVNTAVTPLAAQGCQIISRKPKHRACQQSDQRNILPGVADGLQKCPQHRDFLGLQQILATTADTANAIACQCILEMDTHRTGRSEQNCNVLRLYGAKRLSLTDKMLAVQQLGDPLGHQFCLFQIGAFLHLKGQQLHLRLADGHMGNALVKRLFLAVGKTAHRLAHAAAEHIIDTGKHCTTGAEIAGEHDFSALSGLCLICRQIPTVLFQKNSGICQTELINGLLYIAYHKAILTLLCQRTEKRILHRIGVLIFVHHDLPEAVADLPGSSSCTAAVFAQKQIQCTMLQIAKIQNAAAFFRLLVTIGETTHQGCHSPHRSRGMTHVGKHLLT